MRAAAPAPDRPDPAEVKALEATLRDLLVKNVPDPLVQSAQDWGRQEYGRVGPRLRADPVMGVRNDGHWRRVAVRVPNSAALGVGITEAAYPEPGKTTFTAMIGADCVIRFEQQVWRNGRRLYSGETRGRCRAAVLLKCEATTRTETKPGGLLPVPDLVVRVRVTDAQLFYENLVIDHTAGVGGDAAKIIGETIIDAVKKLKPDLERDLLAKANAAVVKAADTKEVRVSLGGLFGK
ncbi:MAG: hypothetical protein K2X87_32340 [Gemmataceae bacterium]|nr:hypothetical protein [Gemmataceae bacterium]